MKNRVLWLTNIPSPYRVKFFNELGKYCELTVLFEKAYSEERNSDWKNSSFETFNGVVLKGIRTSVHTALSLSFRDYIKAYKNDIIVVGNPATPTGVAAILYMQITNVSYIIESDGAFPMNQSGLKGLLKKRLFSKAQYCFTTSKLGMDYFANYGVDKARMYLYPFTSINDEYVTPQVLTKEEKADKRKKLGIEGKLVIISVGQFIFRKGYDVLLKAVVNTNDLFDVYIIGDNPTEEYLSFCKENHIVNVHFVPFMKPAILREWLLASDLFVLPTREDIWGLVINEAMAAGLPVITTYRCMAGMEMVEDGINGKLVEVGNVEKLREAILNLINSNLREKGESAILKAKQYTIEAMTKRHLDLFQTLF